MSNNVGFNTGANNNTCNLKDDGCSSDLQYIVEPTVKVTGHTGHCDIKVPMWDTIGCETDNIVRVYNKGECSCLDGEYWFATKDTVVTKPVAGSTDWEGGYSQCELLRPLNAEKLCEVMNTFPVSTAKIGG